MLVPAPLDFEGLLNRVAEIVGVSDDLEAVARCEKDVQRECGEHVSAVETSTDPLRCGISLEAVHDRRLHQQPFHPRLLFDDMHGDHVLLPQ